MNAAQFPISLMELVRHEGQGGLRELDAEIQDLPRVRVARQVFEFYRPARRLQGMGKPDVVNEGNRQMFVFAETSLTIAQDCECVGDPMAALLAKHNAASAYGTMGLYISQYRLNRVVVSACQDAVTTPADMSDEMFFVFSKAYVGLIENNEVFRTEVGIQTWYELVIKLKIRKYADFPGRALAFVRALLIGDATDEHLAMLRRAAVCYFGKDEQKAAVAAYLLSLGDE